MVTYNLIIYGFISIIQTKWIIFSSEFLMKYQEKLYKLFQLRMIDDKTISSHVDEVISPENF